MGCQSKVALGDDLTFGICTHDPDTGVLTDCDSYPTYRVYEDETATPMDGGNMGKIGDPWTTYAVLDERAINHTGFYVATLSCTIRNGYERGKTYTIYIEATVDSDKGGMCYAFKPYYRWDKVVIEGIDAPTTTFHHIVGKGRKR